MIPADNQEAMQILHYQNGQKYEPHHDFFHDRVNQAPERGGQRVATVLMYLTTPEEGGETVFPNAHERVYGDGWSDCAKNALAVKAKRGNALLFFSLHPDGTEDPASLHGSCPTTKGDKWSATKWIRVGGCAPSSCYHTTHVCRLVDRCFHTTLSDSTCSYTRAAWKVNKLSDLQSCLPLTKLQCCQGLCLDDVSCLVQPLLSGRGFLFFRWQ